MRHLPALFALLLVTLHGTGGRAQSPQAENMVLLGSLDVRGGDVTRYSDVWGYSNANGEFALLASNRYMHIIDVTDPGNPQELFRINQTAVSSDWRDIKTFGDYAYMVTEGSGEGLTIVDLSNLPASAPVVYRSSQFWSRCHNLFVDDSATPARLFCFGINGRTSRTVILSLANPENPSLLANVSLTGGYAHDGYVINDTLYANHEGRGMYAHDVSNPTAPVELGRLNNYPEAGYNHSVWRTDNGRYAVMCDETVGASAKIVDVEDPLDMEVVSLFASRLRAPANPNTFAHNPYVMGDTQVVMSYYNDGIQVWDIRDPTQPTRLGYYDSTPNQINAGGGIWGAYPYLPSGNILGSDIGTGLYVVQLANALPVTYAAWTARQTGKNATLSWVVAEQRNNAGWHVEHAAPGGQFAELAYVESGALVNEFTHAAPGPGTHLYRLRQVDFDGRQHLSEIRLVHFGSSRPSAGTDLAAYPNPVLAGRAVTVAGLAADADWTLYDTAGRRVFAGRGRRVATEGLRAGAYGLRSGGAVSRLVVE